MKKILIFALSAWLAVSLTACGNGKKAQEAYDAIGSMTFSDESILTGEEKAVLESLKADREEALKDRNVEQLNSIKSEWDAFKEPIESYIGKYEAVAESFFSEDEKKLLTNGESSEYENLKANMDEAYRGRNGDALDGYISEYQDAFKPLHEVIETYLSIDQDPFSENDLSLLSSETISGYEELKNRTEKAFSERDSALLKSSESEWQTFVDSARSEIEEAKKKLLEDWVSSADVTGSVMNLLSFGTITSSTSIDGHRITYTMQYHYDADTSEIKNALETYLNWTSSVFEMGVSSLKSHIDDASIRIEYKDKNGNVICYREFT